MKKKLKLDELKVQSFITKVDNDSAKNVKGAGINKETWASCLAYVSCYMTDCIGDPW